MQSDTLKQIIYGSLKEILTNSKYIYNSSVSPEYSEWTQLGETEVLKFLKFASYLIVSTEREELDRRAKEMVLENLKDNG